MSKEIDNTQSTTAKPFPFFPDNEEYWFETKLALGAAGYGAASRVSPMYSSST